LCLPHQVDALLQLSSLLLSDLKLKPEMLKDFGDAFQLDGSVVDGIVAIAQKNFKGISLLAERFGDCETKKVEILVTLVENLRMLAPGAADKYHASQVLNSAVAEGPENEPNIEKALAGLSYKELFVMFDQDHSGTMDFEEFLDLIKYLHLNLTESQAMKIFSQTSQADGFVDKDNFEKAMDLLKKIISDRGLSEMGLSTFDLVSKLAVRVGLLFCMFGFIFLGIAAFTAGSTLNTVVNSGLTVLSALGLNFDTLLPEAEEQKQKIKDTVTEVFDAMNRFS